MTRANVTRLNSKKRKEQILQCAIRLAHKKNSYLNVTSSEIARAANIQHSLITYHFGNYENLKNLIVQWAIKTNDLQIIAQALMAGNYYAKNEVSDDIKKLAFSRYTT